MPLAVVVDHAIGIVDPVLARAEVELRPEFLVVADIDHGLEWCEDALLGITTARVEHTVDAQQVLSSLMDVDDGTGRLAHPGGRT